MLGPDKKKLKQTVADYPITDSLPLPQPPQSQQDSYRNWAELPRDVTALILRKAGAIYMLGSAQFVCSSWRSVCKDPLMWRSIDIQPEGAFWELPYDLQGLFRNAVDRSCGGLVSFSIVFLANDALINYIADRSRHLKRLILCCCYQVKDAKFCEAAKNIPLLEELEISYCSLSAEALEGAGLCCPLLRSLKLNSQGFKDPHTEDDEEAFAIAKNMPNLRYLQMFGNLLTNEGLQAIIDGCPHLEFLDLRYCFNVNLEGHLGLRCAEQIKDFRGPSDPIDDYPFKDGIHDSGSSEEDDPSGCSDTDTDIELSHS